MHDCATGVWCPRCPVSQHRQGAQRSPRPPQARRQVDPPGCEQGRVSRHLHDPQRVVRTTRVTHTGCDKAALSRLLRRETVTESAAILSSHSNCIPTHHSSPECQTCTRGCSVCSHTGVLGHAEITQAIGPSSHHARRAARGGCCTWRSGLSGSGDRILLQNMRIVQYKHASKFLIQKRRLCFVLEALLPAQPARVGERATCANDRARTVTTALSCTCRCSLNSFTRSIAPVRCSIGSQVASLMG